MATTSEVLRGQRIAQARRARALALRRDVLQSDVATAVGVGAATVSRWEAGEATPRDAALERLAAFLGVTPAYLRYGTAGDSIAEPVLPEQPGVITAGAGKGKVTGRGKASGKGSASQRAGGRRDRR